MAPVNRRKQFCTVRSAGSLGPGPGMGLACRRIIPAVLLIVTAAVPAVAGRVPMPKIPAAKGAHCVRPTQWMRKNHMKLLLQLRYEAVHEGIRHKRESLPGCMSCHVSRLANGKYPSVTSRKFFCNACHDYVGVRIDCFSCHTNRPGAADQAAEQAKRPPSSVRAPARYAAVVMGWAHGGPSSVPPVPKASGGSP